MSQKLSNRPHKLKKDFYEEYNLLKQTPFKTQRTDHLIAKLQTGRPVFKLYFFEICGSMMSQYQIRKNRKGNNHLLEDLKRIL